MILFTLHSYEFVFWMISFLKFKIYRGTYFLFENNFLRIALPFYRADIGFEWCAEVVAEDFIFIFLFFSVLFMFFFDFAERFIEEGTFLKSLEQFIFFSFSFLAWIDFFFSFV